MAEKSLYHRLKARAEDFISSPSEAELVERARSLGGFRGEPLPYQLTQDMINAPSRAKRLKRALVKYPQTEIMTPIAPTLKEKNVPRPLSGNLIDELMNEETLQKEIAAGKYRTPYRASYDQAKQDVGGVYDRAKQEVGGAYGWTKGQVSKTLKDLGFGSKTPPVSKKEPEPFIGKLRGSLR